ncbi:hypothetical protein GLYMA_14G199300v4 [Glycine max]|uniref:Uncharacterized protein n=1 Tax=Glycine max TaxID=3847 RepID=K7M847_SOYBN|nr:hypothetical protein GYH30_040613 [Glycine max]KRH17116.1 hypothetical protein GLYMA_14G199300v4 [Glycine max]
MNSLTTQIVTWLKQVAVWKFVVFVSTVVGLVCYALSSSFSCLFGEWSMLKIFIFLWSLFPKTPHHTRIFESKMIL